LPALGAARFYVSHERWQKKVEDVAKESQLVVWATGVTEGLRWEISHLIENLPPEKLVLWAHPHLLRLSESERETEWSRFRQQLGGVFPKPLPERLGEARFIYFEPDWTPRAVAPPRHDFAWSMRSLLGAQRSALQALLALRQGVSHRSFQSRWREGLGSMGSWLVVITILALIASLTVRDVSYRAMADGKVLYEGSTPNEDVLVARLITNAGVIALAISLLWAESMSWRRARAVGIFVLALIALFVSLTVLSYESRGHSSRQWLEDHFAEVVDVKHLSGWYFNFALAAAVAVLAGLTLRFLWNRRLTQRANVFPLNEEALLYSKPTSNRELRSLIGAGEVDIDWPRIAGFALALLAMTPPGFHSGGLHPTTLVRAGVLTVASVFAFRFIKSKAGAAASAALASAAASWLVVRLTTDQASLWYFVSRFAFDWLFLAALAWATPRIAPLAAGLWVGAMCPAVVSWLWRTLTGGLPIRGDFLTSNVGPILFAAVLAGVDWAIRQWTPSAEPAPRLNEG
jgi:hypothetical protein